MKMKLKYRLYNKIQFILFAFYPATTLITCLVLTVVINIGWALAVGSVPENTALYNLLYAMVTGVTASLIVSAVIECMNNYRNNKLGWYELRDYYKAVSDYEMRKQISMQHFSFQRARRKAIDEHLAAGGVYEENDFDKPKDKIQSTWHLLPKMIPIMRETYDKQKQFLSDGEIIALERLLIEYGYIKSEIKEILWDQFLYNALNHPDEEYLKGLYPKNIVDDMPEDIRKDIARSESEKAIERVVDVIMADNALLDYYLEEYDISQRSIDSYEKKSNMDSEDVSDEEDETDITEDDGSEDEEVDEETFKAIRQKEAEILRKKYIPFKSYRISSCCAQIADLTDTLEKYVLKKPYVGYMLKISRNSLKEPMDDIMSKMEYENIKKELEGKDE